MLSHYIDYKCINDGANIVLNDIHSLLKRNRVFGLGTVGIDFPNADFSTQGLGNVIRIFGNEDEMNKVYNLNLHHRFSGVWCVGVQPVKRVDGYKVLASYHIDGNAKRNRMIRRSVMRGLTLEEAEQQVPFSHQEIIAPFLIVNSTSSQSNTEFKLFLYKKDSEEYNGGVFNHYGLSSKVNPASVPNIRKFG